MQPGEIEVKFQPLGRAVGVARGSRLMEAALEAGAVLDLPCGGEGVCGKCRVRVHQGSAEPLPSDRTVFSRDELAQGFRLACQTIVDGPMTVEVPETSLLAPFQQILARIEGTTGPVVEPVVRHVYCELTPSDRDGDQSDLSRLEAVIGPVEAPLDLLRELPQKLRQSEFRGTAVLERAAYAAAEEPDSPHSCVAEKGDSPHLPRPTSGRCLPSGCFAQMGTVPFSRPSLPPRLLDFLPGDQPAIGYGVAMDVGTTTLVAMLLDLGTGEELAIASRVNPQTAFGDDVLSRILHAGRGAQALEELRRAVIEAADEMIGELADRAGVARGRIYLLSFSGNTTMQQLLAGIDPRSLGEIPFVPAISGPILTPASSLGLRIHPRGRAYVFPVIGGFVGGDTVSGILATGLGQMTGPTLLVDIGTNGEIVLAAEGKLTAASTAAGPAFEGARISQGMRGSTGAIERVHFDGLLRTQVIGGVRPTGLCGSGLIDLAAELLQQGVLGPEGRMASADDPPDGLPTDLRRRLVAAQGKPAFLVADAAETATGKPILLTQQDVRELQLASGAIRAGVEILLRRSGLATTDLDAVLIAGGFGNYVRRTSAQRIGLLPPAIPRERIRYQGNTSLAGARLVALSHQARREAEALARRTQHVDLSRDPDFAWAFADAMLFPDGFGEKKT
jgi:uncharacterized 2Fe-2S/4Fe-4S cluster protein (DUF4445 family)